MTRHLRVLSHVGFFLAMCDVRQHLGNLPHWRGAEGDLAMRRAATVLIVIAPIAALSGFGTVASYTWAGATILLFVVLVLRLLSFMTRRLRATINSNRMRPINWREYCAPRSGKPDGVSLRRSKPIASNVQSRGQPAVASGTNMSSPMTSASLRATAPNHMTSSTWRPPLCWRHLKPRNPIR